jgi:hypothetical protein
MSNPFFSNNQCCYYSYIIYYSIKRQCIKLKQNMYQCICPIDNDLNNNLNNDLDNHYELQEIVIINNDNSIENLSKKKSNSSQEKIIYERNEKTPIVTKQPQKQIDNNELEKPKLKRRNAMKIRNNIIKKELKLEINNKIKPINDKETIYENEVSYSEDKIIESRLRKLVKKKNKNIGISSSDEEEWDII